MQHVRRRVSPAGDRRLGFDVAQGRSSHDDDECQTWPSTKDLLPSHLSKRMMTLEYRVMQNKVEGFIFILFILCTVCTCTKLM